MAYDLPTPARIKALWPKIFGAVEDATIQEWINIAALQHDQSWIEADYSYAICLLAAHLMVTNGIGAGGQAEAAGNGLDGYSTIKSGQLTLTRASVAEGGSGGVPSPWDATQWGVQWYWLARKNRPVAAVTGGFPGGHSGYAHDWPLGTGGYRMGPLG